ncbi:hypothetical protein HD597_005309 [Nonomuraea thailandensis]|uniref:Uncharacterized protein n=1 Tax=Nonomuraea thailandensis TaxID=1188745 RepID=A0A9X2GFQ7_9ACTN|nr:hypothetical protein [Nonomuraea thailandensis]
MTARTSTLGTVTQAVPIKSRAKCPAKDAT